MKFIESAIKYRPKRSPIFWGLIALVLVFITPPMLMMLGATFHLSAGFVEDWIKGESQPHGMWSLFIAGTICTLTPVMLFTAMLCLIFKKYRAASKLIIAAPVCIVVGFIVILTAHGNIFAEPMPELTSDQVPNFAFGLQKLLVLTILFLYARKYLRLENTPTAA